MNKKSIILLSGGLDSSTTLYIAKAEGYETYCISFDYGQRHKVELKKAVQIAIAAGAKEHITVKVDLAAIGGSALTDDIDVPKDMYNKNVTEEIPVTYVPARNLIFLSLALSYAEKKGASTIFIGANALDYSGYPDCRPEFINAFQSIATLATKAGMQENIGFEIKTPLINMSKKEIIAQGISLGVNFGNTHSCYDPDIKGVACGRCDSCIIRKNGFKAVGLTDPVVYK